MIRFLILFALLLAGASTPAEALSSYQRRLMAAVAAAWDRGGLTHVLALEPQALAEAQGRARRDGENLTLTLADGRTKVFTDKPECRNVETEARCEMIRLLQHDPTLGVFMLAHSYYEGVEYLIVDEVTGEDVTFDDLPIFSPPGDRALLLNHEDDIEGVTLQIWRRSGGQYALEWEGRLLPDDGFVAYQLLDWQEETVIRLTARVGEPETTHHFTLERSGTDWQIVPNAQ